MGYRNPYWAPEYTNRKPSFNEMGAMRLAPSDICGVNRGLYAWWLLNERVGKRFCALDGRNVFDDLTGCSMGLDGLVNATGQWATCNAPSLPAIGTQPYCVHIELTLTTLANATGLFSFGSYDPAFAINAAGQIYVYDGGAGQLTTTGITAGVRSSVTWNRILASASGGWTHQYINGIPSDPRNHADSIPAPATLQIGTDRDSNAGVEAIGTIHSVQLWIGASLTDNQVREMHYYPYGTLSHPRLLIEPQRTWYVPVLEATTPAPTTSGATTLPPTTLAPPTYSGRGIGRGIIRGVYR